MVFVGILFALALSAWALYLVPRISLPLFGFAVLVIGTIFGPYFFSIDGPLAISIDRILWVLMLGLFLLLHLIGRTKRLVLGRLDWLVVFFGGWLLISTQMGDPPLSGSPPIARWIFYVCMPIGIYFVARYSNITRRDLRMLHWGLLILGVYLSLTALAEVRGITAAVFPKFIADGKTYEFLGRGRGPLLNPSGNGFLLTLGLSAIFIRLKSANRLGKLGLGLTLLAAFGGVYATLTRSVWMGAAAALALIQLPKTSRLFRVWCVAAAAFLLVGLAVGLGDQILHLKRDKHLSASASAESIELRPLLGVIAFEMFKDRPITGVGYGHYFAYNDQYAQIATWEMPLRKAIPYMQHNVILSYLVDSGLIGAGFFTLLLIAWGYVGWRMANSSAACAEARYVGLMMIATLSAYLINGMFQDVSVIPMLNMYLFYFAGLLVSVDSVDGKLPESARQRRRRASIPRLPARAIAE